MTIDEVIEQFPVTRDQIKAVLEFAARSLDTPVYGLMRTLARVSATAYTARTPYTAIRAITKSPMSRLTRLSPY